MPTVDLQGLDWEDKFFPNLGGGINIADDSEQLQDTEVIAADNMHIVDNILQRDSGYQTYLGLVIGKPRLVHKHVQTDGTIQTFLFTNLRMYENLSDFWHLVSNGTATTLTANASDGETAITVASIAGFTNGEPIGITLDDGTQHRTTINGVPAGSTINLTDAFGGSGVVATSGNAVVESIILAGTDVEHVVAVTVPWDDSVVFTNGVDTTKRFVSSTSIVGALPNLPSSGDTICKSLVVFDSSIFLINTVEGGTNFPYRTRWCDKADVTEWVTGDAGAIDMLDANHDLVTGVLLGPYLYIYRTKSIVRITAVNTATKRFDFTQTIDNEGIFSVYGVISLGDQHFVWGTRDFYVYTGGFDLIPVSRVIKKRIFGTTSQFDSTKASKAFMLHVEDLDEIFCFYPSTAGTDCDKMLRAHIGEITNDFREVFITKWTERTLANEVLGFGEAQTGGSVAWSGLIGSWIDQTWAWDSAVITLSAPNIILCGADVLQCYAYDFLSTTDDGTAITGTVVTKDFGHPVRMITTDFITFKASGDALKVSYSTDQGVSWTLLETITPGGNAVKNSIFRQIHTRTIRFKFESVNTFKLYWWNIRFQLDEEEVV